MDTSTRELGDTMDMPLDARVGNRDDIGREGVDRITITGLWPEEVSLDHNGRITGRLAQGLLFCEGHLVDMWAGLQVALAERVFEQSWKILDEVTFNNSEVEYLCENKHLLPWKAQKILSQVIGSREVEGIGQMVESEDVVPWDDGEVKGLAYQEPMSIREKLIELINGSWEGSLDYYQRMLLDKLDNKNLSDTAKLQIITELCFLENCQAVDEFDSETIMEEGDILLVGGIKDSEGLTVPPGVLVVADLITDSELAVSGDLSVKSLKGDSSVNVLSGGNLSAELIWGSSQTIIAEGGNLVGENMLASSVVVANPGSNLYIDNIASAAVVVCLPESRVKVEHTDRFQHVYDIYPSLAKSNVIHDFLGEKFKLTIEDNQGRPRVTRIDCV